jgi:MFS family permease
MLNTMGFFFLDYLIPVVASQNLGASGIEIGIIFSVQIFGHTISSFFVGFLTDRVKHKKTLIVIGSIGRGSAYILLYISLLLNSLQLMGIGTFSLGFLAGFFWIPFNTLIAEKSRKQNRSEAFGKRDAIMGRGTLLGAIIGFSIFGFTYQFNNSFITYLALPVFGLSNFLAGYFFTKVDENIKISEPQSFNPIKIEDQIKPGIGKSMIPGLIFFSLVLLLANINGSIGRPFLNIFILAEIINDPTIAMLAFIPSGFVSLFLAPRLGAYVDKIRPALGIAVTSFLGAMITWFLINSLNIIVFSVLLVLDTTIISAGNLVFQNFLSRVSISNRGKIMGIQSFFTNFGGIIGPVMGGFFWDIYGNRAPFNISIIVELILIPFYIIAVYLMKPHLIETYSEEKNNKI